VFLNYFDVLMSKIHFKKNIILIYFQTKNTLKNNRYYKIKQTLILILANDKAFLLKIYYNYLVIVIYTANFLPGVNYNNIIRDLVFYAKLEVYFMNLVGCK
jgi:putative ribosome biogenesis GTPase RsgA